MLFRRVMIRLLAICGVVFAGAGQAAAQDRTDLLRVFMNHARVLKLDRPVSKVIVGNASVADATVADPTTIVLTGRSFGTTNLVLLDAQGNAIADERVLVSIDEGNTVASSGKRSVPFCPVRQIANSTPSSRTPVPVPLRPDRGQMVKLQAIAATESQ